MPRTKKADQIEGEEEILDAEETAVPEASTEVFSIDCEGVKCDSVEAGSTAARQLEYYAKQPKVRTRIPLSPGEKPGKAFDTVIVNGLRINILKGMSVSLPEAVAEIVEDANYRTDKALNETKVAPAFGGGPAKPLRVDMQSESDKMALGA